MIDRDPLLLVIVGAVLIGAVVGVLGGLLLPWPCS